MKEKRVKFWRGTAEKYNFLKKQGALDYWTRYSVKYTGKDGSITWKEYYGDNLLTAESGQLLPVNDIVDVLPNELNPGDRFLLKNDDNVCIIEVSVGKNELVSKIYPFKEGMSVRVKSMGYKSYVLFEKEIILR